MRTTSKALLALLAATSSLLAACSEDPCSKRHCQVKTTVAYTIDFALEESEGVSRGFNLDNRISVDHDSKTCGHGDAVDPEGNEGIDNNAAVLFDSISAISETSIEELIRGSINEGRLLLSFQLFGLDDSKNDSCVDVEIFQVTGSPLVGTDGFILPAQTFDIDPDRPRTLIHCASVKDGVLRAGPFDGSLFVSILGVSANLGLHSAMLTGTVSSEGLNDVVLGAAIETSELHELLNQTMDETILGLGNFLVDSLADMGADGNGQCQQLSATVIIGASGAYLF